MFYPYVDPLNGPDCAEYMRNHGFAVSKQGMTYIYSKKTLLGTIGHAYYPVNWLEADGFACLEVLGSVIRPVEKFDWLLTVHVNLQRSLDEVTASLRKDKRWGIKKAMERGTEVYQGKTHDDFMMFHDIYLSTSKRKGLHVASLKNLEDLYAVRSLCKLYLATAQNEVIGAYMVLTSADVARFFYGGFLPEWRDFHPNEFAHYCIIKEAIESGLKVYDMGGAGYTLSSGDFKAGWGLPVKLYSYFLGNRMANSLLNAFHKGKLFASRIKNMMMEEIVWKKS